MKMSLLVVPLSLSPSPSLPVPSPPFSLCQSQRLRQIVWLKSFSVPCVRSHWSLIDRRAKAQKMTSSFVHSLSFCITSMKNEFWPRALYPRLNLSFGFAMNYNVKHHCINHVLLGWVNAWEHGIESWWPQKHKINHDISIVTQDAINVAKASFTSTWWRHVVLEIWSVMISE